MGIIIHGNKNFGYAPINTSGNTVSFGTPVMLEGLVNVTIEVEQNTSTIYADNRAWAKLLGAKVRTATASFRYITDAYAEFLGFHINANGMLTDTGTHANHCIFFESTEEDADTGEETQTLHILYNVKAQEPNVETETDEDEVEAAELEVNYDASESSFVVDDAGEYVQYAKITRTASNATWYDTFTTTVLLPTANA